MLPKNLRTLFDRPAATEADTITPRDDRMHESIAALDPESRALMDLSLVQDVPDDDLGQMLSIDASEVRRRRSSIFDRMGAATPLQRAGAVRALRNAQRDIVERREAASNGAAEPGDEGDDPPPAAAASGAAAPLSSDPRPPTTPGGRFHASRDTDVEWVDGAVAAPAAPEADRAGPTNSAETLDDLGWDWDVASDHTWLRDEPDLEPEPEPEVNGYSPPPPVDPLTPRYHSDDSLFGPGLPHSNASRRTGGRLRDDRQRAGLVALCAAGLLVLLIASLGGSSTDGESGPAPATGGTSAGSAAPNGIGALKSPTDGEGAGNVEIVGDRGAQKLRIQLRDLPAPDGQYVIWLYQSVGDTVPLALTREGTYRGEVALPRSLAGYEYVDVSAEPDDGNSNHSGESVLRIPLSSIPRD